jgi:hypothetical protein
LLKKEKLEKPLTVDQLIRETRRCRKPVQLSLKAGIAAQTIISYQPQEFLQQLWRFRKFMQGIRRILCYAEGLSLGTTASCVCFSPEKEGEGGRDLPTVTAWRGSNISSNIPSRVASPRNILLVIVRGSPSRVAVLSEVMQRNMVSCRSFGVLSHRSIALTSYLGQWVTH